MPLLGFGKLIADAVRRQTFLITQRNRQGKGAAGQSRTHRPALVSLTVEHVTERSQRCSAGPG